MKPLQVIAILTIFGATSVCADDIVMCGLGPPPGSRDFSAWTDRIEKQRQERGYLLICESQIGRYRFESTLSPDDTVVRKLAFKPHSLRGTAFDGMVLLGSIADGFNDGRASMYRRVFRNAGGDIVTFQEFSLDGGATSVRGRPDGLLPLRGSVAQFTAVQTPAGRGFSELEWQEGASRFEVTIDRAWDEGRTKVRLIDLASSLPPSAQWSRIP